jgi:small subunit ribosomal protein S8
MSMSDPIADLLTRIRNGYSAKKSGLSLPYSGIKKAILDTLEREGYVRSSSIKEVRKGIKAIDVELKYHEGAPVVSEIKRVSKPGRRVYSSVEDLSHPYNGLGIYILSTQRGILSDSEARAQNVGGEIICSVF